MVSGDILDDLIVFNDQYMAGRFVTINGGGGNDIIRIEANGAPTLVNGDAGTDYTDFSYANRNLSNITGATTVNGGTGDDSIFVYDNADAAADSHFINSNGMSRGGWAGLSYGS